MTFTFVYPIDHAVEATGRVLVTFPDFPEAATDGATLQEAMAEAADCLEEAVAGRIDRGEPIPLPSRRRGGHRVAVPPQMAAKAALYLAMREAGIANTELARRMNVDEREVRRMLDPHHATKLPRISAAMRELGRQVVLGIRHTG